MSFLWDGRSSNCDDVALPHSVHVHSFSEAGHSVQYSLRSPEVQCQSWQQRGRQSRPKCQMQKTRHLLKGHWPRNIPSFYFERRTIACLHFSSVDFPLAKPRYNFQNANGTNTQTVVHFSGQWPSLPVWPHFYGVRRYGRAESGCPGRSTKGFPQELFPPLMPMPQLMPHVNTDHNAHKAHGRNPTHILQRTIGGIPDYKKKVDQKSHLNG